MEPIAVNRAEIARRRHIERNQERSAQTKDFLQLLVWTVFFCFVIGASPVVTVLTGKAGQFIYRYLIYAVGLFSFVFALRSKGREVANLLGKNVLLLAFLLLQLLFAAFGVSPKDAYTQLFIFITTIFLVVSTRSLFTDRQFLQIIVGLCIFIIIGSIATSLFWKSLGLQPNGAWQGMFGSKNDLGHCVGLATGIIILTGPAYLRNWVFWAAIVLAGLVCIIESKSGSGIVILVGMVAGCQFLRIKSVPLKISGFLIVVCLSIIFSVYSSEFIHSALTSLGKDETLSGRAHVWGFAVPLIAEHWIAGAGYSWTTYIETIQYFEEAIGLPHLHNAYISAAINSGLLCAVLFFLSYLWSGIYALGLRLAPSEELSRLVFWAVLIGWFLSGFSEPGIIDAFGPKSLFGLSASFGLLGLGRVPVQKAQRQNRRLEPA